MTTQKICKVEVVEVQHHLGVALFENERFVVECTILSSRQLSQNHTTGVFTGNWLLFHGMLGTWAWWAPDFLWSLEDLCKVTGQQMLDRLSNGKELLRFDGAATRAAARRGVAKWHRDMLAKGWASEPLRSRQQIRALAREVFDAASDIESEADFNDFLVSMPRGFDGVSLIAPTWSRYTMPADLRELCNVYWPQIAAALADHLRQWRVN